MRKLVNILFILLLTNISMSFAADYAPLIDLTSSTTSVLPGTNFDLIATARDDIGLNLIYIYKNGVWTSYPCNNQKTCSKTITISESNTGNKIYYAYAYDSSGKSSMDSVSVQIIECQNGQTQTQSCGNSNIGACRYGTQTSTCQNNVWSAYGACTGAVYSTTETCNNIDDNCDGVIDNGASNGVCSSNANCNDNNALTTDTCNNAGTCSSSCSNVACSVACSTNSQCDDSNALTTDTCNNAGTCSASCSHTSCSVTCSNDAQCNDNNALTTDTCNNAGTCSASCSYTALTCAPGTTDTQSCGTSNIGTCIMGTKSRTCDSLGVWGAFSVCLGNIEPITETCNNLDDNCDGTIDNNLTINCLNNNNCNDNNLHTIDVCQNAGTCSSICQNTFTNDAPSINQINNITSNQGQLITFQITATDAENDSLNYSATNLPSGSNFNINSQIFTWTPDFTQSGNFQITFYVSDALSQSQINVNLNIQTVCQEKWVAQTNCTSIDAIIKTYTDTNNCNTYNTFPNDNASIISTCDFCTPSWSTGSYGSCQSNNLQSRSVIDINNCYSKTNLSDDLIGEPTSFQACDFCTPSLTNTSWSNFLNVGVCLSNDLQQQERSFIQYDLNYCNEIANQTFTESQFITCDYCIPNIINTSWSIWSDIACNGNQMQQLRTKITYDSNNCFAKTGILNDDFTNITIIDTQLIGPNFSNTSWTSFSNSESCLINDSQLQTKTLIQYDIFGCDINTTFTETQFVACNYCSFNPVNTSFSDWSNSGVCLVNDSQVQIRSLTTYDANYNSCYAVTLIGSDLFSNITITESRSVACDYCTPNWISNSTWSQCQFGDIQFTNYYDSNNCYANTSLASDNNRPSNINQTCDFCTPNLVNTTFSSWSNVGVCLSNDLQQQSRSLIQYDSNNCGEVANQTFTENQFVACNYCSFNPVNTSFSDWSNSGVCLVNDSQVQIRSLTTYDANYNSCYAVTLIGSDLFNNITITESRSVACDYCTLNQTNTSWSDWNNNICQSGKMNQTRSLTQYDSNNCFANTGLGSDIFTNTTFIQSQLIGPNFLNTSWTSFSNSGSCLVNDSQLQTRSLIQYDTLNCAANTTFTESQYISCDYCVPSWTLNSTWTNCDATEIQYKNYYDSNNCYVQTNLVIDLFGKPINQSQACSFDNDADGFNELQGDCNDANALINPNATEVCDGVDNNCDTLVDNGLTLPAANKQLGVCAGATKVCAGVSGFVEPNYSLISNYESVESLCDSLDNDCDASVDEGVKTTYYLDVDSDLFGVTASSTQACSKPAGYAVVGNDCNDANAAINPNATELVGDQVDQNCDSQEVCYVDFDNDNYRLTSTVISADVDCIDSGEALGTDPTGDCNDNDATIYPTATELLDNINQNCVNDAPILAQMQNITTYHRLPITIQLNGTDVDGDNLTYYTSANKGSLNQTTGLYTWTPMLRTDVNLYNFNFTVSDGLVNNTKKVTIRVYENNATENDGVSYITSIILAMHPDATFEYNVSIYYESVGKVNFDIRATYDVFGKKTVGYIEYNSLTDSLSVSEQTAVNSYLNNFIPFVYTISPNTKVDIETATFNIMDDMEIKLQ